VPLDQVLSPRLVRETTERLGDARDDAARVQVVARLLRSLPFAPDPLVAHALERVEHEPIGRLARSLGVSERQLERRFLAQVGLSPRSFATLKRFERALELARRGRSLTEVAHEAGYFDQPHFNRDFRRFTGLSPRALFAQDVGNVQVASAASGHGASHDHSRPVRERAQGPSPGPL
jgi:AraC-like DNA-binding protein